ncbi:hypothetical protein K432DRAFT_384671 [Lepidopterella palustris CBS 459.81]|uniref:Uncharacterized protein n=1 Tax=Lepidopterella palustris CBS 459.81 TaxID=1314670 RepID=A0A8E2E5C1_9PEZI|nr:hypothetical protein K432DRAFT_384671 [Lepidopterella palustris CBS 459.81]
MDIKGECYTRALQQLLTGDYIAELYLAGLFCTRKATGTSILTAILFIGTVIYHFTMNRHLSQLEICLPADLHPEPEGGNGETSLLAAAEEGNASASRTPHPARQPGN